MLAERHRRGQLAQHDGQHRPQPQGLLHHRVRVRLGGVLVRLGAQPGQLVGVAEQPFERPGQHGRGGLVPGDEQGDQFVAQLLVGALLAHQRGKDVPAAARCGPAGGDLGEDRVVHRPQQPARRRGLAQVAGPAAGDHRVQPVHGQEPGAGHAVQQPAEQVLPPGNLGRLGDAEDRPDDHFEGDGPHVRPHRERAPDRPVANPGPGHVGDQVPVAGHPVAVQRGMQQPALGHVHRFVEHQDGALADHPAQEHVGLAGEHGRRVRAEHLLDVLRVGQEHPRGPPGAGARTGHRVGQQVQREHVAVAGAAVAQVAGAVGQPAQRLGGAR